MQNKINSENKTLLKAMGSPVSVYICFAFGILVMATVLLADVPIETLHIWSFRFFLLLASLYGFHFLFEQDEKDKTLRIQFWIAIIRFIVCCALSATMFEYDGWVYQSSSSNWFASMIEYVGLILGNKGISLFFCILSLIALIEIGEYSRRIAPMSGTKR